MAIGGAVLRISSTALYALEFCCAGIILGIYSYFLSVEADRNVNIPIWQQAVTGMAGGVVLYTIFAVLLTCFLGGKAFFAFVALVLDLLCCGAMIAIAVLCRNGASSCTGDVQTPLGNGPSDSKDGFGSEGNQYTYSASLGSICRLNTACFAVAIIGAFLFLISAPLQMLLSRHHKKEKRYGPGPSNGYTKGSGMKFWQRKQHKKAARDSELGAVPATSGGLAAGPAHDYRPSHDTAYTGSTVAAPHTGYENSSKPMHNTHNTTAPLHVGYHTAPTGTTTHTAPALTYSNNASTNY